MLQDYYMGPLEQEDDLDLTRQDHGTSSTRTTHDANTRCAQHAAQIDTTDTRRSTMRELVLALQADVVFPELSNFGSQ